jgi:hypothetical protein
MWPYGHDKGIIMKLSTMLIRKFLAIIFLGGLVSMPAIALEVVLEEDRVVRNPNKLFLNDDALNQVFLEDDLESDRRHRDQSAEKNNGDKFTNYHVSELHDDPLNRDRMATSVLLLVTNSLVCRYVLSIGTDRNGSAAQHCCQR